MTEKRKIKRECRFCLLLQSKIWAGKENFRCTAGRYDDRYGDVYFSWSRILPGTYVRFDDVKPLINVHDRLWDTLENELIKFGNLTIRKYLYEKFETILGHLNRNKCQTAAEQILTGRMRGSDKRFDIWRSITPTTEGIKFLLEMAIKHCGSQGLVSRRSRLNYLIGLSSRIVIWDGHLGNIYGRVVPYEITISPDFDVAVGITNQARVATEKFGNSEKPHAAQSDLDLIENLDRAMGPKIKTDDFCNFPNSLN